MGRRAPKRRWSPLTSAPQCTPQHPRWSCAPAVLGSVLLLGVDDLLADKDSDLADIEAALSRVRSQLGKRRPPPTYYDVDVTLEELYTGCTKEVEHVRIVGPYALRKEVTLMVAVPHEARVLRLAQHHEEQQ